MYRGFDLHIAFESHDAYMTGTELYESQKRDVKQVLDLYLLPNGSLNGSKLQEEWFPQIEADVFISHSHDDEKLALTLAGWLKRSFGLSSFIDSTVWGYADTLLRTIDNAFCSNNEENTSYSYELRNYSTSHVHMMLNTSLMKMIDKTECLFFLNTPNSVTTKGIVENKTKSAWIYAEIAMSELIRRRSKTEHRGQIEKSFSKGIRAFNEGGQIEYTLYLGHLTNIGGDKLTDWYTTYISSKPKADYPLDILYDQISKL